MKFKRTIILLLSIFLMALMIAPVTANAQASILTPIFARIFQTTASRVLLGASGGAGLIYFMNKTVVSSQVESNGGYLPAFHEQYDPNILKGTMYESMVINRQSDKDIAIEQYYTQHRKKRQPSRHRYTMEEHSFMQLPGVQRNPDLR